MSIPVGNLAKAKAAATGSPAKQTYEDAGLADAILARISSITASTSAIASTMYYVTPSASTTLTLPGSPTAGDCVGVFAVNINNAVTVARNGNNINGVANDFVIPVSYAGFVFQYVDSTTGWAVRLRNDHSNPNILINSDGSNPLDQEGTLPATSVTNGAYVADGWIVYHNESGAGTFDVAVQSDGGLRVTYNKNTTGNATYVYFAQKIEAYDSLASTEVAMSGSVRSNVGAYLRVYDGVTSKTNAVAHTGGGTFESLSDSVTLDGTPTVVVYELLADITADAQYVEFKTSKLEVGSVATPWRRDENCELVSPKVLKYFERVNTVSADCVFGDGAAFGTTTCNVLIEHARKYSSAWTLGYGGNFDLQQHGLGTKYAVTSMSLVQRADGKTLITVNVASGLTAGTQYELVARSDATAYLDFKDRL